MKKYLWRGTHLIILLFASAGWTAEIQTGSHLEKTLKNKVDQLRLANGVPGVAVTTFTSRGAQWSYGSGHQNLEKTRQMDAESTLVPVASVSKLFTAVAIHQLVENNHFSLDTRLSDLNQTEFFNVVQSQCPEKIRKLRKIKVKNLLNHTSGILHDLPNSNMWWDSQAIEDGSYPSKKDFSAQFCNEPFLYEPGQVPGISKYSNHGFNLLGQIVEAYGGEPSFEKYIQKYILAPLNIQNAKYLIDSTSIDNLTNTYGKPGSLLGGGATSRTPLAKVLDPGSYVGSVGLNISANALAKFGQETLRWTSYYHRPKLLQNWEAILYPTSPNFGSSSSFGLGSILYNVKSENHRGFVSGILCYGHTGTLYGSRALVFACPELDWGMAMVGNSRDSKRIEYFLEIAQILLNRGVIRKRPIFDSSTRNWMRRVNDFQENFEQEEYRLPAGVDVDYRAYDTSEYLGRYHSDTDGAVEVKINDEGRLVFLGATLLPDADIPDLFYNADFDYFGHTGESVKFVRDSNGVVSKIVGYSILHAEKISSGQETELQ